MTDSQIWSTQMSWRWIVQPCEEKKVEDVGCSSASYSAESRRQEGLHCELIVDSCREKTKFSSESNYIEIQFEKINLTRKEEKSIVRNVISTLNHLVALVSIQLIPRPGLEYRQEAEMKFGKNKKVDKKMKTTAKKRDKNGQSEFWTTRRWIENQIDNRNQFKEFIRPGRHIWTPRAWNDFRLLHDKCDENDKSQTLFLFQAKETKKKKKLTKNLRKKRQQTERREGRREKEKWGNKKWRVLGNKVAFWRRKGTIATEK